MLYQRLPNWVLGFHGTDEDTVNSILNSGSKHLSASENNYDWLGGGIYFWENDPKRALEFAVERMKWKNITDKKPAVIGAVIDLGLCLNLFDQPALLEVRKARDEMVADFAVLELEPPKNDGNTKDRLLRRLDCAVVEYMHRLRKQTGVPAYQSVRAGFHEGCELYPGSGFFTKNHIQIAVRDPAACIKGYFLPQNRDGTVPTTPSARGGSMRKRIRTAK